MAFHPLAGVYAAAVTPLKQDFSPALDLIPSFLDFLARRGCHGALMLGTTGEGPSFSPSERLDVFRAALTVRTTHPGFRLLAGTGTPSLTETIDLTRAAFDLGFDGVVILPPYYFRKATEDGLFAWFGEVFSRAVPADGYLLGYHFPGVTGVGFSLDLLARLKETFPQQFVGIKDSSHELDFAQALGARFGSDLLVLNGTDSYLQVAMDSQSQGCITAPANLISPALRQLWDAHQAGQDVSVIQAQITAQRHILEKYLPFPVIIKALLAHLHGFPHWPVCPPLFPVSQEIEIKALKEFQLAGGCSSAV